MSADDKRKAKFFALMARYKNLADFFRIRTILTPTTLRR